MIRKECGLLACWLRVWLIIIGSLLLTGCNLASSDAEPTPVVFETAAYPSPTLPSDLPVFFPRQQLVDGEWVRMTGEITGPLGEANGCIYIGDYLVIWPPHYAADKEDGQIRILDNTGQVLATVGDEVYMGGGESPSLEFISIPADLSQQIPPQCLGPYWISAGILPN